MQRQKTKNSQRNPKGREGGEVELKESGSWTSDYTTKLQSLKECGTGTKTEKQIDETGYKTQK